MSYEIPKNLKYEEKVVFNFSIRQTLWLGTAFLVAGAIFLKSNFDFNIKAIISMAVLTIGGALAFLDLESHAKSVFSFAANPREMGFFDPAMRNLLGIRSIENDAVILNDGSAKAILEVQPINFDGLQEKEKEAVVLAYRDFLNSIDFPIQVIAKTSPLSLDDYFAGIEQTAKLSGKNAGERLFELREFFTEYAEASAVKNRRFYIVIPAQKKYSAKDNSFVDDLDIRCSSCVSKLRNCGLKSKRLERNEIAALIASYAGGKLNPKEDYFATIVTGADVTGANEK